LVVNQPVAVLRETAIRFLLYLVARQAPIQQVATGKRELTELSRLVSRTDATQADLSWDLPPESAQAMNVVATNAAEIGLRLEVRLQLDPFPTASQLAARVPALRGLYNEEEPVRDAIDRIVSALGARNASIRGGPEEVRSFTRRSATLQGWGQYVNQVTRDAQVCGNGYLVMRMSGLDWYMRCMRPERVVITRNGDFYEDGGAGRLDPAGVLHLRGIDQIDSSYGISVLEPLLYLKARHDFVRQLVTMTSAVRTQGLTDEQRKALDRNVSLAKSLAAEADERITDLLSFFLLGLRPASPDCTSPGSSSSRESPTAIVAFRGVGDHIS
jgi:hypothetical protein